MVLLVEEEVVGDERGKKHLFSFSQEALLNRKGHYGSTYLSTKPFGFLWETGLIQKGDSTTVTLLAGRVGSVGVL